MKGIIRYTLLAICFVSVTAFAQSPKAKTGTFALTNANIQTVTNGVISNGTLIISGGKITDVGVGIATPSGATVIDCKGMWIYPGMIDAGTHIGLLEIGQIDQASDERESGQEIPQMKALTAINPNSVVI